MNSNSLLLIGALIILALSSLNFNSSILEISKSSIQTDIVGQVPFMAVQFVGEQM